MLRCAELAPAAMAGLRSCPAGDMPRGHERKRALKSSAWSPDTGGRHLGLPPGPNQRCAQHSPCCATGCLTVLKPCDTFTAGWPDRVRRPTPTMDRAEDRLTGRWIKLHVLLPLECGYAREVLRGICAYHPAMARWRVEVGDTTGLKAIVRRRPYPAVIAALAEDTPVPDEHPYVLNVADVFAAPPVQSVFTDNRAVGRLAAQHLLDLGYETLVFLGRRFTYDVKRWEGFSTLAAEKGVQALYHPRCRSEGLFEALRTLDPPFAVFTTSDLVAHRAREAAHALGLSVPGQVAILGTDNDPLFCEAQRPYLSSVDTSGRRVGFEAARTMEQLLRGRTVEANPLLVPPAGIVQRESTAKRMTDDPLLVRAIQFVQDHALNGITIKDVARGLRTSGKTLQQHYRAHFTESLKHEILRVQLDQAKRLLTETDMKIIDVALACGFRHCGRFSGTFHKITGKTPAQYRRGSRMR